ncbi:tRNA lysidine(34) synthetase TilS [Tichowtungia aerotolerans]|uniref:tRNA(Ile)-lysidine synthase n=1 Tax=Tichowtungia aerotolerans TaxID=2697043 RepID=A0A6P1MAB3_9BACT|nr:tRNA lysidine(34) synthetase TilS [Tichowtungia aerotolerans]QHI69494.1 tRNA lysidine(34) synthetase TilS [Tichowtungia aerotolerans]
MNLIEKVKAAIERENLIPEGTRVIVGVSGGADSVALLHILHRLGFNIIAAHLNHGIRGSEADADEQFVKDLCAKLNVECITQKIDVPALAQEKGISLEMAAREARHEFFRSQVEGQKSKGVVALAHHADDQLETFFLRAARGTGLTGLGGMRSFQCLENTDAASTSCHVVGQASLYSESLCLSDKQPQNIRSLQEARPTIQLMLIRPMLGIRKNEIFQWLETNKGAGSACFQWLENEEFEWREDASNSDETIPRNLVRHQILPTLGKINARAAENILRTMEILRDEEDHPETAAVRRAARDRLIEFGVNPTFDAVEQFIEFSQKTDGTSFLDLEGVRLINEYGTLRVSTEDFSTLGKIRMEEGVGILRGKWEASVSLEQIAGREVTVRTPRPGDRMNPYGMDGSKKLQDIFTDLKIPLAQRANWPVVECGGEIIWLPGYRIARGWELVSDDEPALYLFFGNAGGNSNVVSLTR